MRSLLVLLSVALVLPAARAGDEPSAEAERPRVVEVRIKGRVTEDPAPQNPFGPVPKNYLGALETLETLAVDDEVDGVVLRVTGSPDMARGREILGVLEQVQRAGKPIACYSEMLTQGQLAYASVADLLVVPPSGIIALEGLTAELMYIKEMLDHLDVEMEVLHIGDYKTAFEDLARDSMSDGQREMLEDILGETYESLLETIAGNRGISHASLEAMFELVLVPPEVAQGVRLVDAVAYEDEFEARARELFGGEYELVDDYGSESIDVEKLFANPFAMLTNLEKLLKPQEKKPPKEPYVAVVYATGTIVSGESQSDFSGNVSAMGSETIVEALEKTYDDDNCKAVVLRVNSPGGSALASDMIWRAIERVKTRKPVVASMGRVAASGGYWISMGCSAIVAQPGTLTGSIGVVSLVPDVSRALEDLGINVEVVSKGPHGDQLAILEHGPSPIVKKTITRSMEQTYETFIEKVAGGRGLEPERVREIAGGRVWTGRQAIDVGLVDELGGLQDAIALACVLGGGLDVARTEVVEYPRAPSFFESLEEQMEGMVSARERPAVLSLAERLGFGDLARTVETALADLEPFSADRVQAVMPMQILVR